jgi:hypothetical protein
MLRCLDSTCRYAMRSHIVDCCRLPRRDALPDSLLIHLCFYALSFELLNVLSAIHEINLMAGADHSYLALGYDR